MVTFTAPAFNVACQHRLHRRTGKHPAPQQNRPFHVPHYKGVKNFNQICRQRCQTVNAAVVGFHEADSTTQLRDIEVMPIINIQGFVSPEVPDGTQATVFAVYDAKQKLQYIGFSKDIRNSLRTVFSRRPNKAHFFKAFHFQDVDQQAMMAIRDAWFEQSGGAPPGNQLAMERTAWQQPVDAGAISQRGKKGAAEEMASQLLRTMKERGCKEEFLPNETLLLEGMVDFLPAAALDQAEVAARRAAVEALAKLTHTGHVVVDGQEKTFSVHFDHKYPTNNGFMMDVIVTYDNQETEHRIIIGKEYYEENQVEPEKVIEAALALLIEKKIPRHTEGMLHCSEFPSNYFSISKVEQWFSDDFPAMYERSTGVELSAEPVYWRFNRIEEYGARNKASGSWRDSPGKSSVGVYNN